MQYALQLYAYLVGLRCIVEIVWECDNDVSAIASHFGEATSASDGLHSAQR